MCIETSETVLLLEWVCVSVTSVWATKRFTFEGTKTLASFVVDFEREDFPSLPERTLDDLSNFLGVISNIPENVKQTFCFPNGTSKRQRKRQHWRLYAFHWRIYGRVKG